MAWPAKIAPSLLWTQTSKHHHNENDPHVHPYRLWLIDLTLSWPPAYSQDLEFFEWGNIDDVCGVINLIFIVFTNGYKGYPIQLISKATLGFRNIAGALALIKANYQSVLLSLLHASTRSTCHIVVGGNKFFFCNSIIGNFRILLWTASPLRAGFSAAAYALRLRFDVKAPHAPFNQLRTASRE